MRNIKRYPLLESHRKTSAGGATTGLNKKQLEVWETLLNAVRLPAGPGQSPGGGPGAEAPGSS